MEIVYNDEALRTYIENSTLISPDTPVLVDRFLDDAIRTPRSTWTHSTTARSSTWAG